MSFDVFVQRFHNAAAAPADGDLLARLLQPYLADSGRGFQELRFTDGKAAIYGTDDLGSGFMVNHVSGAEAWDVLVAIARAAGLTILPVGAPAAVPTTELIEDLPEALRAGGVVVRNGDDLRRVIESA